MMKNYRERILATRLKITEVSVPEWGDDPLYVRGLTGADFAHVKTKTSKLTTEAAEIVSAIWIALLSLCDADGRRVMQDDDYQSFAEQPIAVLTRVTEAAIAVSGMGAAGVDSAKKD